MSRPKKQAERQVVKDSGIYQRLERPQKTSKPIEQSPEGWDRWCDVLREQLGSTSAFLPGLFVELQEFMKKHGATVDEFSNVRFANGSEFPDDFANVPETVFDASEVYHYLRRCARHGAGTTAYHAFLAGRAFERMTVRDAEPEFVSGRASKAGAKRGGAKRKISTEDKRAQLEEWNREIKTYMLRTGCRKKSLILARLESKGINERTYNRYVNSVRVKHPDFRTPFDE